jgi:sorbose reductase
MIERNTAGSIVLVASVSGHIINFPQPQAAYNTAKAAVMHMTRCFAAEWATHGIRVNSISPGYMDTILNEGDALETARGMWKARTPMGRMGKPDELNGVAILLCSAAGSYITGSDIKVDGKIELSNRSPSVVPMLIQTYSRWYQRVLRTGFRCSNSKELLVNII